MHYQLALTVLRMVLLMVLLSSSGCQQESTDVLVSGMILLDGEPLKVPTNEGPDYGIIQIKLVPLDLAGGIFDPELVLYDERDGSFSVPGKQGRGVPPGDYKIVVHQLQAHAEPHSDLLRGRFSVARTPLSVQLKLGEPNSIEIDLSQYLNDAT